MYACVFMFVNVYACLPRCVGKEPVYQRTAQMSVLISTLFEAGSAAQPRSAAHGLPGILSQLSLSHRSAGITDANATFWSFLWVLRIQAQVLMFVQRVLLSTEPSPQPQMKILKIYVHSQQNILICAYMQCNKILKTLVIY